MIERSIIEKIKSGDVKAFQIFYESNFHKIANYAFRLLHSREDAMEVAQDVFTKLWKNRNELDPNRSVDALIFRIAKCMSIDRIRKDNNRIDTFDIEALPEGHTIPYEEIYFDTELDELYKEIVNKLPPKRRTIFKMSRDEGHTHHAIAQKLDISVKTVETQIRLSLIQIRKDIKKYSDNLLIPCLLALLLL